MPIAQICRAEIEYSANMLKSLACYPSEVLEYEMMRMAKKTVEAYIGQAAEELDKRYFDFTQLQIQISVCAITVGGTGNAGTDAA